MYFFVYIDNEEGMYTMKIKHSKSVGILLDKIILNTRKEV